MKLDLFDTKEFVELNHLQEVTSGVLFQRGDVPHPNGLVSNEIFGVTTKSRKNTFAYINLHGHFFHPHIYKALKRLFRNVEKIINGDGYYSLSDEGYLIVDKEDGETGIEFLYNNWEKINWKYSEQGGMRNERIDLILKTPKNQIFTQYCIVIPAYYRDIRTSKKGGGETEDINQMYATLVRLCTMVKNKDMFDTQFHATNLKIQNLLVDIYNYFKNKLEKKNGLLRKYLMGKNVDYCARAVITSPTFHAERPEDLMTDFQHAALPISHVCDLAYPFMVAWLKTFFERNVIENQNAIHYDPITGKNIGLMELDHPASYFTEKYYKKMLDGFMKDPESRFNRIEIPVKGENKVFLSFTGRKLDSTSTHELSTISSRAMTWTDLLYMAAVDVTKDKHCLVTRYPLLDEFGVFIAKIRILSTTETQPMKVGNHVYRWYPIVDLELPPDKIATKFIDSVQFSNSFLPGLDGDYDGDQITEKIIYSQEANEECDALMNSKAFFINTSGQNIRYTKLEVIQTFYTMTKDPTSKSKSLSAADKKYFLELPMEEYTFSNLVNWFGNTADLEDGDKTKVSKSKFNMDDKMSLSHQEYRYVDGTIQTTLGRFMFCKILLEGSGIIDIIGFVNMELTDKNFSAVQRKVTSGLINDKITVAQMYKYTDLRDWLGLQLHGVITTSFTISSLKVPKEVQALKKELLTKYKAELEAGDQVISEKIEKALVEKTKELMKGDVGMDLYLSGARGSISNNYKNMNLYRGAIKNCVTGKYDIVTNSLMDGLDKKDIAAHSNTIIAGAYPKSVGTQFSGYLSKQLIASMQTEVLAEEGSDCGSKGYIEVRIPEKKWDDFLYRYIVVGNRLVNLDDDTIKKYIGKVVKLRTPMYCIGYGKEKCLCNMCAGDFYYKLGKKHIGLLCSRPAETTKRLEMKKFHSNLITNYQIDVDDMLI